jgi:hypothetical protein
MWSADEPMIRLAAIHPSLHTVPLYSGSPTESKDVRYELRLIDPSGGPA